MRWHHPLVLLLLLLAAPLPGGAAEVETASRRLKVEAYRHSSGQGRPAGQRPAPQACTSRRPGAATPRPVHRRRHAPSRLGTDPDRRGAFRWLLAAAELGKEQRRNPATPDRQRLFPRQRGAARFPRGGGPVDRAAGGGSVPACTRSRLPALQQSRRWAGLPAGAAALRTGGPAGRRARPGQHRPDVRDRHDGNDQAARLRLVRAGRQPGQYLRGRQPQRLMTDMSWEELNQAQAVAVDLYREIEELPPRPAAAKWAHRPRPHLAEGALPRRSRLRAG